MAQTNTVIYYYYRYVLLMCVWSHFCTCQQTVLTISAAGNQRLEPDPGRDVPVATGAAGPERTGGDPCQQPGEAGETTSHHGVGRVEGQGSQTAPAAVSVQCSVCLSYCRYLGNTQVQGGYELCETVLNAWRE